MKAIDGGVVVDYVKLPSIATCLTCDWTDRANNTDGTGLHRVRVHANYHASTQKHRVRLELMQHVFIEARIPVVTP